MDEKIRPPARSRGLHTSWPVCWKGIRQPAGQQSSRSIPPAEGVLPARLKIRFWIEWNNGSNCEEYSSPYGQIMNLWTRYSERFVHSVHAYLLIMTTYMRVRPIFEFWFYFSKSFVIQLWLWIDRLWVRIQAKPWGFLKNFLSQRKKISKNMMKEGSNSVSCQLFRRALIAHPTSIFASSAQYI